MNLSAIEHINNTQQRRQVYVPARVKVIEVTAQRVLCQSGGNRSMGERELNEDDFESL